MSINTSQLYTVVNFKYLTLSPEILRMDQIMKTVYSDYYTGPERRITPAPRRARQHRRHRLRSEALVSDCRILSARRFEDESGEIDISSLYTDERASHNNT